MTKHIKHLAAILFVAATLLTLASCNKDSDDKSSDGGSSPTPQVHSRMYGTSWTKVYKDFTVADEGYYEDHLYIHLCTATLKFKTDNTGERTLSKDVYDELQHETVEHFSDTTAHFTYVYKGGDNLFGPGMIYWDNGDSSKFYVQGREDNQWIYLEGEDFPDYSLPEYHLDN